MEAPCAREASAPQPSPTHQTQTPNTPPPRPPTHQPHQHQPGEKTYSLHFLHILVYKLKKLYFRPASILQSSVDFKTNPK